MKAPATKAMTCSPSLAAAMLCLMQLSLSCWARKSCGGRVNRTVEVRVSESNGGVRMHTSVTVASEAGEAPREMLNNSIDCPGAIQQLWMYHVRSISSTMPCTTTRSENNTSKVH